LAGEAIAVEETENGLWQVRFFDATIGVIDPVRKKLRRMTALEGGHAAQPKP
jgi:putative transposase